MNKQEHEASEQVARIYFEIAVSAIEKSDFVSREIAEHIVRETRDRMIESIIKAKGIKNK